MAVAAVDDVVVEGGVDSGVGGVVLAAEGLEPSDETSSGREPASRLDLDEAAGAGRDAQEDFGGTAPLRGKSVVVMVVKEELGLAATAHVRRRLEAVPFGERNERAAIREKLTKLDDQRAEELGSLAEILVENAHREDVVGRSKTSKLDQGVLAGRVSGSAGPKLDVFAPFRSQVSTNRACSVALLLQVEHHVRIRQTVVVGGGQIAGLDDLDDQSTALDGARCASRSE